jgi:YHS domain-containing protein
MLRKELVIGYVVAGFISVYVSHDIWSAVFFQGHGFLTTVENVIIGPFIAVVSFVCSIGNVPLAAALWHGGLGFGGVIAFIFADLITFPLLLIYRKYYGTRLTLRLFVLFWLVMSGAGLITDVLFGALGWIPHAMHGEIVHSRFEWNYTSFLNFLFLAVFAVLYWLHRNRARLGGGKGYAIDPVCGMQVRTSDAPASSVHNGDRVYFCSDHCRERFQRDASKETSEGHGHH